MIFGVIALQAETASTEAIYCKVKAVFIDPDDAATILLWAPFHYSRIAICKVFHMPVHVFSEIIKIIFWVFFIFEKPEEESIVGHKHVAI